jgi:hypothetical protein
MTLIERINTLAGRIATEIKTKQATLVSGTNIKTVGGNSLMGAGDISLPVKATAEELATGTDDAKYATAKALKDGNYARIYVGTTAPADTTLLWLDIN